MLCYQILSIIVTIEQFVTEEGSNMKTSFDISKLWQIKRKHKSHPSKALNKTHSKKTVEKDEWDMSPEDALRVTYSGHK